MTSHMKDEAVIARCCGGYTEDLKRLTAQAERSEGGRPVPWRLTFKIIKHHYQSCVIVYNL